MKPAARSSGESNGWRLLLPYAALSFFVSCTTYNPQESFEEELISAPAAGLVIRDVPDISRFGRQDGVAALNALVAFWGREPVTRPVREDENVFAAPVDEDVQSQLMIRGLWSFAFYGTMTALEERLERGIPLLVLVQDNPLDVDTRRYMILAGVNKEADKILAKEGGPSPGVYTYSHFRRIWRPVRNWTMIICPPENMTWELRMMEHVARARYQERTGNWSGAMEDYNRAIQLDPDNLDLRLARGDALFKQGDAMGALSHYRNVLNDDDLNARAANNLAFVLAESNADMDEAERLVRRALTIEPANPVYLDTLGYVLMQQGRYREAANALTRAYQRMEGMPFVDQRHIVERLLSAFKQSNQSHLARQIIKDYQVKDPDFMPPSYTDPPVAAD